MAATKQNLIAPEGITREQVEETLRKFLSPDTTVHLWVVGTKRRPDLFGYVISDFFKDIPDVIRDQHVYRALEAGMGDRVLRLRKLLPYTPAEFKRLKGLE